MQSIDDTSDNEISDGVAYSVAQKDVERDDLGEETVAGIGMKVVFSRPVFHRRGASSSSKSSSGISVGKMQTLRLFGFATLL